MAITYTLTFQPAAFAVLAVLSTLVSVVLHRVDASTRTGALIEGWLGRTEFVAYVALTALGVVTFTTGFAAYLTGYVALRALQKSA